MIKIEVLPAEAPSLPPNSGEAILHQHILLAEDDCAIRQLNTRVLTDSGYAVDAAEDGEDAWVALQLHGYDLLITDNDMPKLSGLDLLKKLHAAHMDLPSIMASGTMPTEELDQEPGLQTVERLVKPYSVPGFLGTVAKVLHAADEARGLPIQNESRPAREPAAALTPKGTDALRRILVVDDDGDTRQLSVDVLVGHGYDVDSAKDGADGWESLQTFDYDLVITDNKMPRMTGLQMIEKLRSSQIPVQVIMATGTLPMEEFARKPQLRPEAMLERPFSNEDLLVAVKKILGTEGGHAVHRKPALPKHL